MANIEKSEQLEEYRPLLRLLASTQLSGRLSSRLDASDIVQAVMLKAAQNLPSLEDRSEASVRAWLKSILANEILDEAKFHNRQRRSVKREDEVQQQLDDSLLGLAQLLPANQTSPSVVSIRNENIGRLISAIDGLPPDQREVIIRKHLQNQSIAEIGTALHRTPAAVAGLLRRALKQLREVLGSLQTKG